MWRVKQRIKHSHGYVSPELYQILKKPVPDPVHSPVTTSRKNKDIAVRCFEKMTDFQKGLSDYLWKQEFDFFCTFTTRETLTSHAARRLGENIYNQLGGKEALKMFWVSEQFKNRYGVHLHALINSRIRNAFNPEIPYLGFSDIKNVGTKFGRCQVLKCQQLPAAYYISKYVTKSITDYDYYF